MVDGAEPQCRAEPRPGAATNGHTAGGRGSPGRERRSRLGAVIAALPVQERDLFYRKYYYCQSTAQMAAELGLTERAVEGRLYRLRQGLRQKLGGELDD